jgi:hypothetical protein
MACFVTPVGSVCLEPIRFGFDNNTSGVLSALFQSDVFVAQNLHNSILSLIARDFNPNDLYGYIGISSGGNSIFPTTIENPEFRSLQYLLVDGEFRDTHNRYKGFKTEQGYPLSNLQNGDRIYEPPIVPSSLGAHTSLTITARAHPEVPVIQLRFEISTKIFGLDFLKLHLNRFHIANAHSCDHDPRSPLSSRYDHVVPISVESPLCRSLSIVLTHKNPEAQFLACAQGWQTLFQGESCLDCAVEQVQKLEFLVVIQS